MKTSPFRIPKHLASIPGYREHQAFIYSGMGNGSGRQRNPIGDCSCKQRLTNSYFRHAEFCEFSSSESYFRSSRFIGVIFSRCKFNDVVFSETDFTRFGAHDVSALRCNFEDVTFRDSSIELSSFTETNLQRTCFRNTDIRNSSFIKANAREVWFSCGSIKDCSFVGLDFRNANLHVSFENAHFDSCDMRSVNLSGAIDSDCEFHNVDLTGASFSNIALSGEVQGHVPEFHKKVKDLFFKECRKSNSVISFSSLRAQCVNKVCRELVLELPNTSGCEFSSAALAYGIYSGLPTVPELRLSNREIVQQVDRFCDL